MTRMDSTRARGATPRIPLSSPLPWPWPAISEAIQVPCTPQSGLLDGVPTPVRSGPVITDPARSGTPGATPLSITATITPWPRVRCQAAGALTAFSTHCWAVRTLSALAGIAPMIIRVTAAAVSEHRARSRRRARSRVVRAVSIPAPRGSAARPAGRRAARRWRRPRHRPGCSSPGRRSCPRTSAPAACHRRSPPPTGSGRGRRLRPPDSWRCAPPKPAARVPGTAAGRTPGRGWRPPGGAAAVISRAASAAAAWPGSTATPTVTSMLPVESA